MEENKKHKLDYKLIIIILLLSTISLLALYSCIPILPPNLDGKDILLKQIMWYIISLVIIVFLLKFGNNRLFSLMEIFYWILMVLLFGLVLEHYGIVNVPFASTVNGATCWYNTPLGSLQPSEFMKIVLVIICASIINDYNNNIYNRVMSDDITLFINLGKYILPACFLIYIQPDSGLTLIILFTIFIMLIVSGIDLKWLYIGFFILLIIIIFLVLLYLISPNFVVNTLIGGAYKLKRFTGWLFYEEYKLTDGWQLYKSLLGIGSAGFLGNGIQNTVISFSEAQTDFIFAVIGSSFGFIGTIMVVVLSFMLDFKLFDIFKHSKNNNNKYIIAGVIGMIIFQQIVNISMVIGLLPITGITLPFLSYGGSSLLSYMIIVAIVLNISSENKNDFSYYKE